MPLGLPGNHLGTGAHADAPAAALQAPDPQARIRALLEERAPAYRQADVLIHTGFRSPKEVAQQVLHQFHLARR